MSSNKKIADVKTDGNVSFRPFDTGRLRRSKSQKLTFASASNKKTNKVLLHACCAPCLSNSIKELLEEGFSPVVYFYNPNIFPYVEYQKRLEELVDFCKKQNYPLIVEEGDFDYWNQLCAPLKHEKEGGKRCEECFKMRLEKTAEFASEQGFEYFCTTLTISPHKNSKLINKIGRAIASQLVVTTCHCEEISKKSTRQSQSVEIASLTKLARNDVLLPVSFLERNFKKNDGFKKSLEISKEFGLFRQNYCGCEYSMR